MVLCVRCALPLPPNRLHDAFQCITALRLQLDAERRWRAEKEAPMVKPQEELLLPCTTGKLT